MGRWKREVVVMTCNTYFLTGTPIQSYVANIPISQHSENQYPNIPTLGKPMSQYPNIQPLGLKDLKSERNGNRNIYTVMIMERINHNNRAVHVLMNTWRKELVVLHDFFNTESGFSQSFQNGQNFPPKLWTLA